MADHDARWAMRWAALAVEELRRCGVRKFCVSPGSRSTPLAVAVAESEVRWSDDTTIHFDERGAGFFGVGWAKGGGGPAALICTSGTAVANYLPAVVEASLAETPLIVLSADRPAELHDCGANQTMDQAEVFGRYVRWRQTLPCPGPVVAPSVVLTAVGEAVARATGPVPGPVHLNLPFREALFDGDVDGAAEAQAALPGWWAGGAPWSQCAAATRSPSSSVLSHAARVLSGAERGLVVAGRIPPDAAAPALSLAEALGWPVLADVQSGMRRYHPLVMPGAGPLLQRPDVAEALSPDVVLRLGDRLVSKRVEQYLGALPEHVATVQVPGGTGRRDPSHRRAVILEGEIEACCRLLSLRVTGQEHPRGAWVSDVCAEWAGRLDGMLLDGAVTEPGVARVVMQGASTGMPLWAGNSMVIRDLERFGGCGQAMVGANRGCSGIDGTVASALGFAEAAGRPGVAVVGDLALLHDLNSLAMVAGSPVPLVIVCVNNGGGGVFHFLPIADNPALERFFAAAHNWRFKGAAAMFGLPYRSPGTMAAFRKTLEDALHSSRPTLIELRTDREQNHKLHQILER